MTFYIKTTFLFFILSHFCYSQNDTLSSSINKFKTEISVDSLKNAWIYSTYNKKIFTNNSLRSTVKQIAFYSNQLKILESTVDYDVNERTIHYMKFYLEDNHALSNFIVNLTEKYSSIYEKSLKKKNLPIELKYLPAAISSNNNLFVSSSGSVGVWQLLYPQARLYKLNISSLIDERRDIQKSSDAAASYLKDLYDLYKDWPMTITAFACTPALLNKAIRRSGGEMKLEKIYPHLPKNIRDTYYAFVALAYIHSYKKECELSNIKVEIPVRKDSLITERIISLKAISFKLNLSLKELQFLNPVYRTDIVPKNHILYLPLGSLSAFISQKDSIYFYFDSILYKPIPVVINNIYISETVKDNNSSNNTEAVMEKVNYKVKSGDNLGYIATLYNTKVSNIQKWNNIYGTRINVGQNLVIYIPKSKSESYKKVNEMSTYQKEKIIEKNSPIDEEKETFPDENKWHIYIVNPGDNLFNIAKKYPGISAEKIMELNSITEDIYPGQKLKIKLKR